jgi:pyruvate/2-oxoglutarate dehydrogenase complex dihydrolipoamide acyltransferase (E2) component
MQAAQPIFNNNDRMEIQDKDFYQNLQLFRYHIGTPTEGIYILSFALKPEEIQGGTYTLTNVGSFGNWMGTPIIPQPQVAILAVGAIIKKPAVIETPEGDMIAVRHKMFLSHSYDHRVVDGALGGMFVRRVADYLEQWDVSRDS